MKVEILMTPTRSRELERRRSLSHARVAAPSNSRFAVAVSAANTPWTMSGMPARENVAWFGSHFFQFEEWQAPERHLSRNLSKMHESLLEVALLRPDQIYTIPAKSADLTVPAAQYSVTLRKMSRSLSEIDHYVVSSGLVIGLKTFAASAQLKQLQNKLGFQSDLLVVAKKELLERGWA